MKRVWIGESPPCAGAAVGINCVLDSATSATAWEKRAGGIRATPAGMSIERKRVDALDGANHRLWHGRASDPRAGVAGIHLRQSTVIEWRLAGLRVESKRTVAVEYRGHPVGTLYVDIVVEDLIVVEVKAG